MSFAFWVAATLAVAGGLSATLLKNLVHCALAVTAAFAGLAFLFLQLDAQFAGFAQILVYIGTIAILIVFAILLTRSSETPTDERGIFSKNWFAGVVVAAGVFAAMGWAILRVTPVLPGETPAPEVTVHQIGEVLIGRYVLPLEIVALLLTAALIGAVVVAMHEKGEAK